MSSMKKFIKYLIAGICLYVFVSVVSYAYILKAYKNISEYEIETEKPKIEIIESKATFVNGYILGYVTNNTGMNLDENYLKIDLYSKENNYLGTKYIELKDFYENQTIEFKSNFKFNGVESYKINFVNSIAEDTLYNENEELRDGLLKLIGIAGIIMFLYYIF